MSALTITVKIRSRQIKNESFIDRFKLILPDGSVNQLATCNLVRQLLGKTGFRRKKHISTKFIRLIFSGPQCLLTTFENLRNWQDHRNK